MKLLAIPLSPKVRGKRLVIAIRLGGQTTPTKSLVIPISLGGLAFAGLLRSNRYGSLVIDPVAPQYDVAANAAFTNLNTASAWQTQGSVDMNPSIAPASGHLHPRRHNCHQRPKHQRLKICVNLYNLRI